MKRSTRIFIILYMSIGIVALIGLIRRLLSGDYQGALFSGLIFAFCAYRAYSTMQKDAGEEKE